MSEYKGHLAKSFKALIMDNTSLSPPLCVKDIFYKGHRVECPLLTKGHVIKDRYSSLFNMPPRRQNKIEKAIAVLNKSTIEFFVHDDKDTLFLFKKTERVVAAIYLVTGILSDREYLRYELREGGTVLLNTVLSFRVVLPTTQKIREATNIIARLTSILDLAHIADLLSFPMLSLLKDELLVLKELVESKEMKGDTGNALAPLLHQPSLEPVVATELHKGQKRVRDSVRYKKDEKGTDSVLYEKDRVQKTKRHLPRTRAIQDGRKTIIIDLLRKEGGCSIKDISSVIRGCSTKSIQRLLSVLIQEGVVETEGEKRWTKYLLKGTSASPHSATPPSVQIPS